MAKYNNQKAKILFLQQMLSETGEGKTISMQQILENLSAKGIRAERKSIYDDMDVLRYFGMEIEYSRERPAGYYMVGNHPAAHPLPEAPAAAPVTAEERTPEEPSQEAVLVLPDPDYWKQFLPDANTDKQMKLSCSAKGAEMAQRYFGSSCQTKQKEDGSFSVTAPLMETEEFFGWLTAANNAVHIQKPKKTAQMYREYLKTLFKSYKEK